MKSFKPRDDARPGDPPSGGRNEEADFRGEKGSNETHMSTADPDAWLYRKGPGMETELAYFGHALIGKRRPSPTFLPAA